MVKNKKIISALLAVVCAFSLCGCGMKSYFTDPNAKYKQRPVADNHLENGVFYVKNGIEFTPVYHPSGTFNDVSQIQDNSRVMWTGKDQSLIPTLYKGEVIAYKSSSTDLGENTLERFYNIGYSLGIYGMTYGDDKYLSFSVKKNTIAGTSANTAFQKANSDSIRIVSINDEYVTKKMINKAGIFTGLKRGKDYHISFYAGTAFQSVTIKADARMYSSYEIYDAGSGEVGKKDYASFTMPKGAKSGYYMISGAGLFKYYNFRKGEKSEKGVKMNIPFYKNNNEQLAIYSQLYSVTIPTETHDISFYVKYDNTDYEDSSVIVKLVSPDDTLYSMNTDNGVAKISLGTAIAGKWIISIYPKDVPVLDVGVDSAGNQQEAIKEEKVVKLKKDQQSLEFCADYTGSGSVWGTVTYEDGTSQDLLVPDRKQQTLSTTFLYAKKGTYTIDVYHYTDTKIKRIYTRADESRREQTIISVED